MKYKYRLKGSLQILFIHETTKKAQALLII